MTEPTLTRRHHGPPARVEGELWEKIRGAYVTREIRPTNGELALEFSLPENKIQRASADQGWAMLRAKHIEGQLENAGAGEIVMQALKSSRAIVSAGEGFALVTIQKLLMVLEQVNAEKASSTNANTLNTLTFAFGNVAKAAKDLGIVGFAKALQDEGRPGGGTWNPKLLQQINVTVKNLTSKAGEQSVTVEATESPDSVL